MTAFPTPEAKTGQVSFLPIGSIFPSPENDKLYKPIDPRDPEIRELARSIQQRGVMEPVVLTQDHFILSGHRRYAAARLAGCPSVPVRFENVYHDDPGFMVLLREFNRQREKTTTEKVREEVVSANPADAYRALKAHRQKSAQIELDSITIHGEKTRSAISEAKLPFLNAAIRAIESLRRFWPVSVRQVHYQLLNDPPLIHAKKPDSQYRNNVQCYKSLSDLLTRARLSGAISMNIIADETRPVLLYTGFDTTRPFLRKELDDFLKGYYRNLQQSQPNHIEIIGEKNTVQGILRPVASEFCIPLTIGRGYSSLPPRHEMAQRFVRSGKENLILLVLSDFDPDGEEICHSFARSMRDDFGFEEVHAIKVALTYEQVKQMDLPPSMEAKKTSANYQKFAQQYGDDVFELEAVPPTTLQTLLRQAIDSVMDIDAYNAEVDAEEQDAADLEDIRYRVQELLAEEDFGDEEDGDDNDG